MTSEERAAANVAKRARRDEDALNLMRVNWRFIDSTQECFLLSELPPEDAFIKLKGRPGTVTYLSLFQNIVTPEVVAKLKESYNEDDLVFGRRTLVNVNGQASTHNFHRFILRDKYIWQKFAVEIRMIGC